jgi:hypothetical protein
MQPVRTARSMMVMIIVVALLVEISLFALPPVAAAGPASLSFDGVSGYVAVPDHANLRIPVNITLEAWLKPISASGYRGAAGKHNYEIGVEGIGSGFRAVFAFSRNSGSWFEVKSGELPFNQWYHIAGTYDGSNVRLFVNGTRIASTQTSGNIDQSTDSFRIGSTEFFNDYFQGSIDEVRLSNSIRYTGNFIAPQMPFTPDANTRGLWHLDEGQGSSVADSSGGNHNGTISGGAAWVSESPFNGPDTTAPIISDISAGSLTTTSATIIWATNEQANSQVEYGPTNALGSSTLPDPALVSSHSQSLTGLSPNTTYFYRVLSRDGAGNQSVSPISSFTTPLIDPPSAPLISSIGAGGISSTGATITWNTDVPADSQVEYGLTTSYGQSTTIDPALTVSHAVNLTGLAPGTTYHYRVKSRGANGVLSTSIDAIFTTAGSATATNGQWEPAMNWPLVAVHGVMQPGGNILLWDAWELKPNVFARVWNPTSQTFTAVTNQFSSVFCAGHSLLADGRILVAGGYTSDGVGIKDSNIFNPATNSWSRVADMAYERWYPSTNILPDGTPRCHG